MNEVKDGRMGEEMIFMICIYRTSWGLGATSDQKTRLNVYHHHAILLAT